MMKTVLKLLGVVVLLLVVAGVAAGWYLSTLLQPVSPTPVEAQSFVVPKGQAVAVIANRLHEAGLVKHPLVFRLVAKQSGLDTKFQAGSFQLSPSMTQREIAQNLTSGTTDVWLTIPEGWRKEEIADSLEAQELDSFDKAEFLALAKESEGQLFPDTYLVPRQASAELIYNLLTNTFERKVVEGLKSEIAESEHSLEDAIVMASILEREATGAEEMKHVAGVLWGRLEVGMPIQADATLQYIKGYSPTEKSWWVTPLAEDKKLVSPYNTYLSPNLPPGPISNPGLDAIKAALDPLETNDVYYIHDRQGNVHYARTLDEHNANVDRYLR
jgi:UPF0755 protein